MIYVIIMTTKNGDETVISTHGDVEEATNRVQGYKEWDDRGILGFRIETIQTTAERLGFTKAKLSAEYGKQPPVYQDTDSILETPIRSGIGEYTIGELFPTIEGECRECGVLVYMTHRHLHVAWHNKLLP